MRWLPVIVIIACCFAAGSCQYLPGNQVQLPIDWPINHIHLPHSAKLRSAQHIKTEREWYVAFDCADGPEAVIKELQQQFTSQKFFPTSDSERAKGGYIMLMESASGEVTAGLKDGHSVAQLGGHTRQTDYLLVVALKSVESNAGSL